MPRDTMRHYLFKRVCVAGAEGCPHHRAGGRRALARSTTTSSCTTRAHSSCLTRTLLNCGLFFA